jgi:hypothetical protein
MYSQLLGQIGDDVRGGGGFADVLAGHWDDPESSAIRGQSPVGFSRNRLTLSVTPPIPRCADGT